MKILCITKRTPRDLMCFDTTYSDYNTVKSDIDINTVIDIIVVDEVEETVYIANLSKMLLQQPEVMAAADYTELESVLDEGLLVAYKTKSYIPKQRFTIDSGKLKLIANTTDILGLDIDLTYYHMRDMVSPKIVSASHSTLLTESYGTISNPSLRNVLFLRNRLRDLIFTHKNQVGEKAVNFANTIPSISGKIHYPIVFEDELYVKDGTKSLKNVPEGGMGNVLIDFTPVGDIDIVRFPDCEKIAHPAQTIIRMPEGKSFKDKTALFVVAGRFVMSSEFRIMDERSFVFNPWAFPLKNIILSNKAILGEKIEGTMLYQDTNPEGTFEVEMMDDDNYENFIILIDNPTCEFYMLNMKMVVRPNVLKFPPFTGGVLIKNMTREIIDYSLELESDQTIVYLAPTQPLNRMTNEVENNMHNIAYQTSNVPDFNHSINDKDDGYTVIDIVAEG